MEKSGFDDRNTEPVAKSSEDSNQTYRAAIGFIDNASKLNSSFRNTNKGSPKSARQEDLYGI